jgi:AraC-like DNA-binding protein
MAAATFLWTLELIRIAFGGMGTGNLVYISWAILFLFIYYASYTAFVQRDLFEIKPEMVEIPLEAIVVEVKSPPESSPETPQESDPDSEVDPLMNASLDKLMRVDELYLDPDLDIYKLSKIAGVSSRNITKSIKSTEYHNFSEWVNKYRVDFAIQLLEKNSNNQLTIEGIGYNSGFNSRSAMYMAFKKIEGHTPGFYKK